MSPDINRILVLFLVVAFALAVLTSLLLMRLYRRAVQSRMSSFGRETIPGPEPAVVRRSTIFPTANADFRRHRGPGSTEHDFTRLSHSKAKTVANCGSLCGRWNVLRLDCDSRMVGGDTP